MLAPPSGIVPAQREREKIEWQRIPNSFCAGLAGEMDSEVASFHPALSSSVGLPLVQSSPFHLPNVWADRTAEGRIPTCGRQ